jgi:hypothetical protein
MKMKTITLQAAVILMAAATVFPLKTEAQRRATGLTGPLSLALKRNPRV